MVALAAALRDNRTLQSFTLDASEHPKRHLQVELMRLLCYHNQCLPQPMLQFPQPILTSR